MSSISICTDSIRSEGNTRGAHRAPESTLAAKALKLAPVGAELSYREHIESLKDESNFEELGDETYLYHEDDEARLLWAFHRPSGSHPAQVEDPNTEVAIMGFNHSRLGAYERFTCLNPAVIENPDLRRHIRNRSRMLFRSLVDNDFTELLEVLEFVPVFIDLACDQMINGRIWNEDYASPINASRFLERAASMVDERLGEGVCRRLKPLKLYDFDEAKGLLSELAEQAQKLHEIILKHYCDEYETWMKHQKFHPLQSIVLHKQIKQLKDSL